MTSWLASAAGALLGELSRQRSMATIDRYLAPVKERDPLRGAMTVAHCEPPGS
ncbi:MAG TPA: hypothetical protein VFR27_20135 [Mycobacterium sp.]|nr:hypothetical protein [Mycobacterium sp.]